MTDLVWVGLGAAVGAPSRYLLDRAVQARHDTELPWGTLAVNLVGSFVLGVLLGIGPNHAPPAEPVLVVGTGFCGAFTTYSTFAYETLRLAERRAGFSAVANTVVSVLGGLGAVLVGLAVGTAMG